MVDLDSFPVQLSDKNLFFLKKTVFESNHGLFAMVLFMSKLFRISCLYLSVRQFQTELRFNSKNRIMHPTDRSFRTKNLKKFNFSIYGHLGCLYHVHFFNAHSVTCTFSLLATYANLTYNLYYLPVQCRKNRVVILIQSKNCIRLALD